MLRLICAFVVRLWYKQVFSWHGSFYFDKICRLREFLPSEVMMGLQVEMPSRVLHKWATTWHSQQNDLCTNKGSGQPGHPPSLIRVFAVRFIDSQRPSASSCGQRRLRSNWVDAGHTGHSVFFGGFFFMQRLIFFPFLDTQFTCLFMQYFQETCRNKQKKSQFPF